MYGHVSTECAPQDFALSLSVVCECICLSARALMCLSVSVRVGGGTRGPSWERASARPGTIVRVPQCVFVVG